MANEVVTYKSTCRAVTIGVELSEKCTKDGLTCVWSGRLTNNRQYVIFSWTFDWTEYKNERVDGLSGHIIVKPPDGYFDFDEVKIDVDLTEKNQVISKECKVLGHPNDDVFAIFEYALIPHRNSIQDTSYDELFLPSDHNDTILVVEGMKLYVCKVFLSYHSDYFRALFSTNYKEGQMDEIPIPEISYQDFGLLLSTIYPINAFPSDKTAEKLLELADRFMIPSVTHKVEHHLLNHSKIPYERMMWMADKYRMLELLDKTLSQVDTLEKAKILEKSKGFSELSNDTNAKLLKRIMKLI